MFWFTKPSSGQFVKQSTFSECTHYGIPYFLQVILILKITLNSVGRYIIWNLYKNSCQYIFIKICEIMLAYIFIYITSNLKALVRWICLHVVDANIVSYWLCSKFWRTINKDILAVLCKAKFQVVYHMLILLFWELLFQDFFLLPSYGRLSFRLCIIHLTVLISTVLSILDTVNIGRYVHIDPSLRQFYELGVSVYWRMSHSQYCIGNWFNSQDCCLYVFACD